MNLFFYTKAKKSTHSFVGTRNAFNDLEQVHNNADRWQRKQKLLHFLDAFFSFGFLMPRTREISIEVLLCPLKFKVHWLKKPFSWLSKGQFQCMNKICNRFRRPGQRLINAIQKQTNFCNTYFANNRWFDIFFRIQKRSRNRNRVKTTQTVE